MTGIFHMHLHLQLTIAPAMSSSLGAIFFIITLGLQQTAFHVPPKHRGALLICKMDSKSRGTVQKMCFLSCLAWHECSIVRCSAVCRTAWPKGAQGRWDTAGQHSALALWEAGRLHLYAQEKIISFGKCPLSKIWVPAHTLVHARGEGNAVAEIQNLQCRKFQLTAKWILWYQMAHLRIVHYCKYFI